MTAIVPDKSTDATVTEEKAPGNPITGDVALLSTVRVEELEEKGGSSSLDKDVSYEEEVRLEEGVEVEVSDEYGLCHKPGVIRHDNQDGTYEIEYDLSLIHI